MDKTISTTTKTCCLSAKFSVSINIPGLTQQLSVSKLKILPPGCDRGLGTCYTDTSVPRHLHCGLSQSRFPKWEAEESAVGRCKEPYLFKDGIYQPDSSLLAPSATKMLLPEPTREKESLFADEGEKHSPWGTHPKQGFSYIIVA